MAGCWLSALGQPAFDYLSELGSCPGLLRTRGCRRRRAWRIFSSRLSNEASRSKWQFWLSTPDGQVPRVSSGDQITDRQIEDSCQVGEIIDVDQTPAVFDVVNHSTAPAHTPT